MNQTVLPMAHFDGPAYEPKLDFFRLDSQIRRIFVLMQDRRWRTLSEIHNRTGDPESSISAQLRHLRKSKFGSHEINRRRRGDRALGLFEYQLVENES